MTLFPVCFFSINIPGLSTLYVTLQFFCFVCLFLAENKLKNVQAISTVIFILQMHIIDSACVAKSCGTTVKC